MEPPYHDIDDIVLVLHSITLHFYFQSVLVGDSDGQINVFLLTGVGKQDASEVKIYAVVTRPILAMLTFVHFNIRH